MFMSALGSYISEKIGREDSSLKAVDSKFNDKDIESSVDKTLKQVERQLNVTDNGF